MPLIHIAPGALFVACRHWYAEPLRTRKVILAGCGYLRVETFGGDSPEILELEAYAENLLPKPSPLSGLHRALRRSPDRLAYDILWRFGPPSIPGGDHSAELNSVTLCVFGELTEDESRRSPEVFRFHSRWRTAEVMGLAAKAYEDRTFAALPILADALEEAGCDNLPLLNHCREATLHTRGCWVLDHILGFS